MKILICGLPGAGKTTLANELAPLIGGIVLDGDYVRETIQGGYMPKPSQTERVAQANTMTQLAYPISKAGHHAICSFICPTEACRAAFKADFTVWVDRPGHHLYPDTMAMWQNPKHVDVHVTSNGAPYFWANVIANIIEPAFNPTASTALFVGRYQPFHGGHKKLIEHGIDKYGQVCIAVRNTSPAWPFDKVKQRIEAALAAHRGKFIIVPLPNIAAVCYGRDVGYQIDHIELDRPTQDISATKLRAEAALREADKGVHPSPL